MIDNNPIAGFMYLQAPWISGPGPAPNWPKGIANFK